MELNSKYDVAIIGGGLAGLSLSIQLARAGIGVVLIEKEKYPFHKVCGEYISMESWSFLESLGLPLSDWNLPRISRLCITAPDGKAFNTDLPLGGFGISRYVLDQKLAAIAISVGVTVIEQCKVTDVINSEQEFLLSCANQEGTFDLRVQFCCGAYGKRGNLDVKWKRSFIKLHDPKLDNYVGVKYHISTNQHSDLIGLHNFTDGYCGISQIEENKYCLCYMTKAENLRKANNNIEEMESKILSANPALKEIFRTSKKLEGFPVAISQISFQQKTLVENDVILLGDSAGMITPLCGNGMSMALHSSKMLAPLITAYMKGKISREELITKYSKEWKKAFASRMATGRLLQRFFGSAFRSNLFVGLFKLFPFIATGVIKKTHGEQF
jgi:flavin-dependent dehydrogenase